MTTNGEWQDYLAHNAPDELAAWFDAEHVETEERALDGDTEPENEDSRERLEADVRNFAEKSGWLYPMAGTRIVLEWLDRQAAITERETAKRHELFCETCEAESDKQIAELKQIAESKRVSFADRIRFVNEIDELTAERDKLQEQLLIGWECECRLQDERDTLQGALDIAVQNESKLEAERERYRSKFGKCLDYADAIHALMDDEGMA